MSERAVKITFTAKEVSEMLLFKMVQDGTILGGSFSTTLAAERYPVDTDMKLVLTVTRLQTQDQSDKGGMR